MKHVLAIILCNKLLKEVSDRVKETKTGVVINVTTTLTSINISMKLIG